MIHRCAVCRWPILGWRRHGRAVFRIGGWRVTLRWHRRHGSFPLPVAHVAALYADEGIVEEVTA